MLFHNTSDLSPTVQASSSYFSFNGYFIGYISMLLPAGGRGEPKAASKSSNFPRNLGSDFGQYPCERAKNQQKMGHENNGAS
jgi:hypothetical protein